MFLFFVILFEIILILIASAIANRECWKLMAAFTAILSLPVLDYYYYYFFMAHLVLAVYHAKHHIELLPRTTIYLHGPDHWDRVPESEHRPLGNQCNAIEPHIILLFRNEKFTTHIVNDSSAVNGKTRKKINKFWLSDWVPNPRNNYVATAEKRRKKNWEIRMNS